MFAKLNVMSDTRVAQWFSNGGTRTPRGTWGYCRGYVRDIIISLSLDIPIISLYFKAKRCVVKGYLACFFFLKGYLSQNINLQ